MNWLTGFDYCICVSVWLALSAIAQDEKFDGVQLDQTTVKLIKSDNFAEAERHVRDSKVTEDPVFLAWLAIKNGRKEEGLDSLKQHFHAQGTDADQGIMKTLTVLADASPSDAVEFADECLKVGQGNPAQLKLRLVSILLRVPNGYTRAAELFDEVADTKIELGEDFKVAAYSLAMYEYQHNMSEKALRRLEVLFDARPDLAILPEFRAQWAHVARRSGKEMEAIKELDRVQSEHPEKYKELEGHILLSRGLAFESMGNLDEARKVMVQLIELADKEPRFTAVGNAAKSKLKEWDDKEPGLATPTEQLNVASWEISPPESNNRRRWLLVAVNLLGLVAIVVVVVWIRSRR